ncbi:MAG: Ldh family oxidoreductase [Proteobacteria bacterium]|nr:Ldh family oxidoreductase [Pseudomonadota bacterium]
MPDSPKADQAKSFPHETVREQIALFLSGWGMPPESVEITSRVMIETDLRGIDTHGLSMITEYYDRWRSGHLTLDAKVSVVHETPVVALIDGGGGLGHVPAVLGMRMAIAKAKVGGISGVGIRNSGHFGAAGYYTRMAADEGVIGIAMTAGSRPRVLPTFGAKPKLSTNPIAFAAPAARHRPYSLDMATSTVATGKIRNKANEGAPMPIGWACDKNGRPTTDPADYFAGGGMTALGGTPEGASYKGYGLAMLVEVLSSCLTGASLVTSPDHGHRTPGTMEIGHFLMVIDPAAFQPKGTFEERVSELIDDLHETRPVDPAQPVRMAGERADRCKEDRLKSGIPVPPGLHGKLKEVARRSNVEFILV